MALVESCARLGDRQARGFLGLCEEQQGCETSERGLSWCV